MKKVLAIALTLALVLALAVTSSAALSSKWTEIAGAVIDSAEKLGSVSVENNAIVLSAPAGGWWPQAGVKYADAVTVEGLEITFNAKAFTDASPNGYFAITLGKKAFGDFANVLETSGIVGGRSHGLGNAGNKTISITFYGDQLKMWITDGGSVKGFDYAELTKKATPGQDTKITFYDTVDGLRIRINDQEIQYVYEDEETGDDMTADLIIDASDVITNGKAYLALTAQGYGGSGTEAVTIKKIDGVAANAFGVSNNNGTSDGPADIDVVIIAGAMVVALVAAAFVLKARKA